MNYKITISERIIIIVLMVVVLGLFINAIVVGVKANHDYNANAMRITEGINR
jgi:cytochrome c-type biogenesis protein CcmE